jgi:hypothetical protein
MCGDNMERFQNLYKLALFGKVDKYLEKSVPQAQSISPELHPLGSTATGSGTGAAMAPMARAKTMRMTFWNCIAKCNGGMDW